MSLGELFEVRYNRRWCGGDIVGVLLKHLGFLVILSIYCFWFFCLFLNFFLKSLFIKNENHICLVTSFVFLFLKNKMFFIKLIFFIFNFLL